METFCVKDHKYFVRFLFTLGNKVTTKHTSTASIIYLIAGHTFMGLFQAGAYRKP